MQTVERGQYLLWTRGVLLHFEHGAGVVVNEMKCERADKALGRGETIAFTVGGEIVSYVVPTPEAFVESTARSRDVR